MCVQVFVQKQPQMGHQQKYSSQDEEYSEYISTLEKDSERLETGILRLCPKNIDQ